MAVVTLEGVWLNDAANLADRMCVESAAALARTRQQQVGYQHGASGRVRMVVRQQRTQTWEVTCTECPPVQLAWLQAHIARMVCVRDHRGNKIYGSYGEVGEVVNPWNSFSDVSFTLTEVTHSEATV